MFSSALTYAGGVKDLQIEGMSIGDSLLDYVNEEKIKKSIANHRQYDQYENINDDFNVEYSIVEFSSSILPLETYETVSFDIKKNDKKFTIETISGGIFFENIDGNFRIFSFFKGFFENMDFENRKLSIFSKKIKISKISNFDFGIFLFVWSKKNRIVDETGGNGDVKNFNRD